MVPSISLSVLQKNLVFSQEEEDTKNTIFGKNQTPVSVVEQKLISSAEEAKEEYEAAFSEHNNVDRREERRHAEHKVQVQNQLQKIRFFTLGDELVVVKVRFPD